MSRPTTLRDYLVRAVERVALAWGALVLVVFVLWLLPMSVRAA